MTKPTVDYDSLAECTIALRREMVWCRHCQLVQGVNVAECLQHGWPKCCGYTMTIDSPDERAALAKGKQEDRP